MNYGGYMIPFARILGYGNVVVPSNIKKISCGDTHYVVLMESGLLYGIGYNNSNQLKDCTATYQYYEFVVLDRNAEDVWCGSKSTLIYTKDGKWIFNGNYDVLGTKNTTGGLSPIEGDDITNTMPSYDSVKELDIGLYTMGYIDIDNQLYSRGWNSNGACGLGSTNRISSFTRVGTTYHQELYVGDYSMIARGISPTSVYLYGAGQQPYGQFGSGNSENKYTWGIILNGGTSSFMATRASTLSYWTPTTIAGSGWQINGILGDGVNSNTQLKSWSTKINMPSQMVIGGKLKGTPNRNIFLGTNGTFYATGLVEYSGLPQASSIFKEIPKFTTVQDNKKVQILGGTFYSLIFDGNDIWGVGSISVLPGKKSDGSENNIFTKIRIN
ncbi:hypothetical protein ENKO_526c [Klebsiella phage fENko-Kae01]|nr:hypothetical protein [Klebsiella phage fENko-Kae01]